jgi:hypothetical protein
MEKCTNIGAIKRTTMSSAINDFFSSNNTAQTAAAIDAASATGGRSEQVQVAGTYLMKVKTIVAKKKDGSLLVVPRFETSTSKKSEGALQCNIALEVVDGTEAVPAGSTLFNTITMAQPSGAPAEKVVNTAKFMKPVVCALIDRDDFEFNPGFVTEYMTIDYNENTLKITRDHKMTGLVMCVCEEYSKQNGTIGIKVKSIRKAKPGEKSVSIKREPTSEAELATMDSTIAASKGDVVVQSMPEDYSPSMDADSNVEFQIEDA